MGNIYTKCVPGTKDEELFRIVKRAAIHAFGPFADKAARHRLIIAFGGEHFICLSNNKDDLLNKFDDIADRSSYYYRLWSQIDVARITTGDGEGIIKYYQTRITFEARRANDDIEQFDRDEALRKSFEECLKECISSSDNYCMA